MTVCLCVCVCVSCRNSDREGCIDTSFGERWSPIVVKVRVRSRDCQVGV